MHPRLFWKTTPRKFNALCAVHADLNSMDDAKSKKSKKTQGVGKPDTFIDKI